MIKRTALCLSACLVLAATSALAEDPANNDPKAPTASATPSTDGSAGGGTASGTDAKPTKKDCDDLQSRETQRLGGDVTMDQKCAKMRDEDGGSKQNQ